MKERKRARVERGAVNVPEEPGNKDDEQMAVRHAMFLIHIGRRGSETENEEQSDNLRKAVRFEQDASNASASSDPYVTAILDGASGPPAATRLTTMNGFVDGKLPGQVARKDNEGGTEVTTEAEVEVVEKRDRNRRRAHLGSSHFLLERAV